MGLNMTYNLIDKFLGIIHWSVVLYAQIFFQSWLLELIILRNILLGSILAVQVHATLLL